MVEIKKIEEIQLMLSVQIVEDKWQKINVSKNSLSETS